MFWKYAANLHGNVEITLQHGFSPVNLLHTFRTLFPNNTSISCITRNHPQTSQTSHTTYKPPTNQPYHEIPDKLHTNQPNIASPLPWRHFLWLDINWGSKNRNICGPTKYDLFTHARREEKWVHFLIFLPNFAFSCLHCTVFYHP